MSQTFRLGVFIVATLAVLFVGVFLIGGKQFLFSSTYHLKADFQNVSGLYEGAEVRVGKDSGDWQKGMRGTLSFSRLPANATTRFPASAALNPSHHAARHTAMVMAR